MSNNRWCVVLDEEVYGPFDDCDYADQWCEDDCAENNGDPTSYVVMPFHNVGEV